MQFLPHPLCGTSVSRILCLIRLHCCILLPHVRRLSPSFTVCVCEFVCVSVCVAVFVFCVCSPVVSLRVRVFVDVCALFITPSIVLSCLPASAFSFFVAHLSHPHCNSFFFLACSSFCSLAFSGSHSILLNRRPSLYFRHSLSRSLTLHSAQDCVLFEIVSYLTVDSWSTFEH